MTNFYTYAYLRASNNTPYYIGKGCGRRAYSGAHNVSIPKDVSKILILKENLTEAEAHRHEKYLIAVYGLKREGGILYNLTYGGEGVSGRVLSVEARQRISEARKAHKEKREYVERRAEKQRQFYRSMSSTELEERMNFEIKQQPNRQEVELDNIVFASMNAAARYCFDNYNLGKTTAIRYLKAGIHPSQKIRKRRKPKNRHSTYC